MNKIYKHIWSKTLCCLVAVSENANGKRSKKTGRRKPVTLLAASSCVLMSAPVLAQSVLPVDGKIVAGQGSITTNGNAMTIRQSTDRMITNWQNFSIGKDAAVTFHQPNASSVALNRVIGQAPTQILGSLQANGQVFLVNPNGVVIGQSGSVQTGAFIASTLGLKDQDFLAGQYHFSGEGRPIVNQGNIEGKVVALIAPSILNAGSIKGNTALAAGTDAQLDFDGDGLLSIHVNASTLASLVDNKGLIQADGGKVIMTAKGASDALKGIVNNSGKVQAQTVASKDGRILLLGDMEHGEANIAGTLDASAPHGGDGGFIETSAAKVKVADDARITTRSANGKTGSWLIDPNDFTIAASGGNITGSALATQLGSSNVTISTVTQGTAGGNGDINVNDTVSWSANTLTLHAERNVVINSAMTGSATAGLALEYGQAAVAAGNTATYTVNAPVNLASTGSFSTKLGSNGATTNYTIVTSLGNAASSNDGTLQGIAGDLSGNYVLGADINASATSGWNAGAGFTRIGDNSSGNSSSRYTGIFDGLGHVITGLTINLPASSNVGMFGYVDSSGVIRNVGLSGGSVAADSYVGQVAGVANGTIANVYAGGNVTATNADSQAGDLVGRLNGGTITNSHATGQVSGAANVGGLVGVNFSGTVSNSYATGNVTASAAASPVGGLVGVLDSGTITNSHATGQVSGGSLAGGLVGFSSNGTISNTYATGNVTATAAGSNAGGLVGFLLGGTITTSYATGQISGVDNVGGLLGFHNGGTITYSYAQGSVTASAANSDAGGLVGFFNFGTIADSYATGAVSGTDNVGGLVGFNNTGSISNTYATGLVTGSGTTHGGGLIGFASNGSTISSSYWDTSTTGLSNGCGTTSTGTCTVTGLSTTAMKNPFSFIDGGWDFSSVWGKSHTGNNNGYMVLHAFDNSSYDDYVRLSNTNLSKTYGSANPSLASITLDGLGTGNATLSWGSAITTATNAGTYSYDTANVMTVTDTVSGHNLYTDYGSGALTVNKATLTVTANNASKTYDGQAFSGGNGATYTGFVNSENASVISGTLSYGGNSQGAVNTGTYTIVPSGLSATNYNFSYVNGALSIDKASLTVTANDASKTYDGQAFSGNNGVSYSGFASGDNASVLSGTLSYGGTAQGARSAGSYTISPSGLSAANYNISYANGTLAINPAPLTIAANDASKTYDGQTFSGGNGVTYTGFVNGENTSALSGALSFGGTSQGARNAGTYTIVPSGLSGQNYAITYLNGALTVNKAPLSAVTGITANNKTYDGTTAASLNTANAAFTGMIPGDTLKVVSASGSFSDKNAGTGKTVNITGITLGGADADNYSLASTTAATTATINKAPLTITANDASKTYDGQTFPGNNGVTYAGFVNNENPSALSGTLSVGGTSQGARNAGTYTIVPSGLSGQNYDISYVNGALSINQAILSAITGITANNKIYDGTTRASLNTTNAAFTGMIAGDSLNVASATGNFANGDPGMNKTVFITGLALGGADAPNYVPANTTATATANISAITRSPLSPQQMAITSDNKITNNSNGDKGFFKLPAFEILSIRKERTNADVSLKGENQTANLATCLSPSNQSKTSPCD